MGNHQPTSDFYHRFVHVSLNCGQLRRPLHRHAYRNEKAGLRYTTGRYPELWRYNNRIGLRTDNPALLYLCRQPGLTDRRYNGVGADAWVGECRDESKVHDCACVHADLTSHNTISLPRI